jgi:TPP-dependent pyruvate/acetoin dehydrogenase alpha subunit
MNISKDKKLEFYSSMYTIRRFEESVRELFTLGLIRGSTHVYIGEEAVAAGACGALGTEDYIVSTHRGHGHCLAKGGKLEPMMAELLGKATGYCKGKGGSMHIADPSIGILGAVGIVGSGLPLAVGAALSSKTLGNGRVTIAFFGDGASNQGTFHECLNLASVLKLPIVFICENNLYAITVACSRSTSVADIADRAAGYNMPGVIVDGNDVEEVYRVTKTAVDDARAGGGPTLIEAKTYRQEGHWIGDPQVYRKKGEVEDWIKKDPIKAYGKILTERGTFTTEELKDIRAKVDKELEKAIDKAKKDDFLSPDKVTEDVYS